MKTFLQLSDELAEFAGEFGELRELLPFNWAKDGLLVRGHCGPRLGYERSAGAIDLYYDDRSSLFRQFAGALCDKRPGGACEERRVFARVSFMIDNSRNAVMRPEAVCELIRILALLGYRELQLYTEDTYEVAGEPYFGYLRGGYTREELRRIDAYAGRFGIELVPCIQTLAHLRNLYRYEPYYSATFDCNDVLLADSERTYELIEHMVASCRESFSSRRINIGMDEARMMGRGKYLDLHGYVDREQLYRKHLARVLEIVARHGFRAQMWGDMLCAEAVRAKAEGRTVPRAEGVSLILWNYGNPCLPAEEQLDPTETAELLKTGRVLADDLVFCGGAAKWFGFTPNNAFSLGINEAMLDVCEREGIAQVMLAAWGDCGGETPVLAVLPNIAYFADRAFGVRGQIFRDRFSALFGSLEDFLRLDCAMSLSPEPEPRRINTANKYLLFNDPLLGVMDRTVRPEYGDVFRAHAALLEESKRALPRYGYLFATQIALLRALAAKYDLGLRTRAAYRTGDIAALTELWKTDYPRAIRAVERFFERLRAQWLRINKPHGFDVQEIRFGAALFRLRQCRRRIGEYLRGEIAVIEELAEEILDQFGSGEGILMQNWGEIVSVNTLIEYFSYV